jgi:hypothetical protein
MPFIIDHQGLITPLTESRALSAGWMWQIPTQDRIGCGYVYDSRYLTDTDAQAEVEAVLGYKITPIKWITFDPGRLSELYTKNTMSIGLAGSFLEPLQATSIHTTVIQLEIWHQLIHRSTVSLAQANTAINSVIDQVADLVQLHYKSGRSDSAFWQHQQRTPTRPGLEWIKNIVHSRWPSHRDLDQGNGSAGYGVFIYPLINYGLIPERHYRVGDFYRSYGSRWRRHCESVAKSVIPQQQFIDCLDRIPRLTFSRRFDSIDEPVSQPRPHPFFKL